MLFTALITILGLSLFETISSVDNAIINAEVLSTMSPRGRIWFLTWGILFAIFVVRGVLPFVIIWFFNKSAPILLMAGGVFLVFLFLHWLFLEDKSLVLCGGFHFTRSYFMVRLKAE
jgi:hypothetical protein